MVFWVVSLGDWGIVQLHNVLAWPRNALRLPALLTSCGPLLRSTGEHYGEILAARWARERNPTQLRPERVAHNYRSSSLNSHVAIIRYASHAIKCLRQESLFLPLSDPQACYMYAVTAEQIGEMAWPRTTKRTSSHRTCPSRCS